uniref:Retrotransposon protein, putative, Ty1-copia subclass n=1 Tax=Tanacetum cinerariifolium TaxID=118510 RepID=A0A699H1N8_TANCI|nr:retrotransposon protein, putative, Ty1-copia subclass [Tanacetum cinerariifolium]
MTKKPFSHKTKKVNDVLGLIHTGVCSPLRHVSKKGASYFITFTDDYSRYGYVYLLKHDVFKTFKDYALETAARILNMVPTKKVDKTPYEIWHGKVPNLSYLKVWDCEAHVKRHTADKLEQRSVMCIFVGYPKESMGYYFYYPTENKVVVESEHPIKAESLALIIEEDVVPVRRSARTPKAPNRLCLNVEIVLDQLYFNVEVEEHSLGDKGIRRTEGHTTLHYYSFSLTYKNPPK